MTETRMNWTYRIVAIGLVGFGTYSMLTDPGQRWDDCRLDQPHLRAFFFWSLSGGPVCSLQPLVFLLSSPNASDCYLHGWISGMAG